MAGREERGGGALRAACHAVDIASASARLPVLRMNAHPHSKCVVCVFVCVCVVCVCVCFALCMCVALAHWSLAPPA